MTYKEKTFTPGLPEGAAPSAGALSRLAQLVSLGQLPMDVDHWMSWHGAAHGSLSTQENPEHLFDIWSMAHRPASEVLAQMQEVLVLARQGMRAARSTVRKTILSVFRHATSESLSFMESRRSEPMMAVEPARLSWPSARRLDAACALRDALGNPYVMTIAYEEAIWRAAAESMAALSMPHAHELCVLGNPMLDTPRARFAAQALAHELARRDGLAQAHWRHTAQARDVLAWVPLLAQLPPAVSAHICGVGGLSDKARLLSGCVDATGMLRPAQGSMLQWMAWGLVSKALFFGEPVSPGGPFDLGADLAGGIAAYGWLHAHRLSPHEPRSIVAQRWCEVWETLGYSIESRGLMHSAGVVDRTAAAHQPRSSQG